jgi:C-terminal processing protease CtpA/Prc
MKVENDAFAKKNREMRKAGADDRIVELRMPMGIDLEEDENGNVYVKSIDKNSRAAKSGKIFVGDIVAMVSATFGDDMWSCRGVGLNRVLSTIKVRNSKPVRLVLEAPNEQEEKKRRAIAYAEASEEEKQLQKEVRLLVI